MFCCCSGQSIDLKFEPGLKQLDPCIPKWFESEPDCGLEQPDKEQGVLKPNLTSMKPEETQRLFHHNP